jgi:hypothetical protein
MSQARFMARCRPALPLPEIGDRPGTSGRASM